MMNLWYVTDLVCAKDTYEYNNNNYNNTVYIIEKTTIKHCGLKWSGIVFWIYFERNVVLVSNVLKFNSNIVLELDVLKIIKIIWISIVSYIF